MAEESDKPTSWTDLFGLVTPAMLWVVVATFLLIVAAAVGNAIFRDRCLQIPGFSINECAGMTAKDFDERLAKELEARLPKLLPGTPSKDGTAAIGALSITVQRFGGTGPSRGYNEGDYTKVNRNTFVASRKEYPICSISAVGGTGGYCTLLQSPEDDWRIDVDGDRQCRVTCFKLEMMIK